MTSLKAPRATAPLCSWSPAPGRPLPVLTVAPQRTSHLHHFPPFPLPLLLPHQCGNSRKASDFRMFPVDSGSGPHPSAATHLCHNVGVRHIKMICVKFTECWTKSEKLLQKLWNAISLSRVSERDFPPFFRQSGAAEVQNELVEGVRLGLLLFLLISLLLLHCFLKGTSTRKVDNRIRENAGVRWRSQIGRRSSCPRRRNPRCRASSVCIPPGTYLTRDAYRVKQEFNSVSVALQLACTSVWTAVWPGYVV